MGIPIGLFCLATSVVIILTSIGVFFARFNDARKNGFKSINQHTNGWNPDDWNGL